MVALLNQSRASRLYQQQQQVVPRLVSFFLGSCIVLLSYFETQVKTVSGLVPLVLM
jgi:hypothetical protein